MIAPRMSRHMKELLITDQQKESLRPFMSQGMPMRAWRSRDYLAQLFRDTNGFLRLTVNRIERDLNGEWEDGITWDELERVKQETIGDKWAVEIYPPRNELVDAHNMRHLWVLDQPPAYAWTKHGKEANR